MMKGFSAFLTEANSVGAQFEQETADMVNRFLKKNGLSKRFKASRYQSVSEAEGRDEDYSDVQVENVKTGEKFFIECKEFDRSNVLNMQFDITENYTLKPVKDKSRHELNETESELAKPFIDNLQRSDGFRKFVKFMRSRNRRLAGSDTPGDFYFGKTKRADDSLPDLIDDYNELVKSGKTEADCKEFKKNNLRDSTKNMLVCALCWRLMNPDCGTWDICQTDDIPNFGKLVRNHYRNGKREAAKYIQFGDKLFRTGEDNPLNLDDVPVFPNDIDGKFTLKFTPRFGTGSVYITPRSEITSELDSDFSFNDEGRWPSIRERLDESGKKTRADDSWFVDHIKKGIEAIVDLDGGDGTLCDELSDKLKNGIEFIIIEEDPILRRQAAVKGYSVFKNIDDFIKNCRTDPAKVMLNISPASRISRSSDVDMWNKLAGCGFSQIAVKSCDIDQKKHEKAPVEALKIACRRLLESKDLTYDGPNPAETCKKFYDMSSTIYNMKSDRVNIKNFIKFLTENDEQDDGFDFNTVSEAVRQAGYAVGHAEKTDFEQNDKCIVLKECMPIENGQNYTDELSRWFETLDSGMKVIFEKYV